MPQNYGSWNANQVRRTGECICIYTDMPRHILYIVLMKVLKNAKIQLLHKERNNTQATTILCYSFGQVYILIKYLFLISKIFLIQMPRKWKGKLRSHGFFFAPFNAFWATINSDDNYHHVTDKYEENYFSYLRFFSTCVCFQWSDTLAVGFLLAIGQFHEAS